MELRYVGVAQRLQRMSSGLQMDRRVKWKITPITACGFYGRTSSAVMRLEGLNLRHLRSRSSASADAEGNMSERNLTPRTNARQHFALQIRPSEWDQTHNMRA